MSCDTFALEQNPKTTNDEYIFVANIQTNISQSHCVSNTECAETCSYDLLSESCISCTTLQNNCELQTECLTCLSETDDVHKQTQCARDIRIGLSNLSIGLIILFTFVAIGLGIMIPIGIKNKWGQR
jgi:hypothetical protein